MSRTSDRFHLNDGMDRIWFSCSIIGLCIICIITLLFIKIMQNIYCIPQQGHPCKFRSKTIKTYSAMSAIFAALNATVDFSAYFVCSEWECHLNSLQWIYDILIGTCYTLAKVFLYGQDRKENIPLALGGSFLLFIPDMIEIVFLLSHGSETRGALI